MVKRLKLLLVTCLVQLACLPISEALFNKKPPDASDQDVGMVALCEAEKLKLEEKSKLCECENETLTTCDFVCEEDESTTLQCIDGTLQGGVCSTKKACPSISNSINFTADEHQCANYQPCQECTPNCKDGYYYHGEPNVCFGNSSGWQIQGECRYLGVHRVGIGVYILNIGSISLQDNSFYVDFILTVMTEDRSFRTYDEALKTFDYIGPHNKSDLQRECSPRVGGASLTHHLGSGPSNGYKALSPTQFLRSLNLLTGDSEGSEDRLDMTFITMDRLSTVTKVQYNSDTTNWRVQGKAYFKPQLKEWPFDTQRLDIMIEALEQTLNTNVTFVMCHMSSYSGLSPGIRFPDHEKQLRFGAEAAELCWPPFDNVDVKRAEVYKTLDNPTVLGRDTCSKRFGHYASSRYIAFVEYSAPERQRFMKAYLPVCFISYINAMSYILAVEDYSQRITICTGTLSALVLFHVALVNQLPSSESITLADNLLLNSYGLNFVSWMTTLIIMLLFKAKSNVARSIASISRWVGPAVTLVVVGKLCSFDSHDVEHSTERLLAPVTGAVVGGVCCWVLEKVFVRYFFPTDSQTKGNTTNADQRKHPTVTLFDKVHTLRKRKNASETTNETETHLLIDETHMD
eukprot:m.78985 g.78985  ORF g.78985 m.78985 type:complete len:630 (+) comp25168_c0_seq2:107-1996(+)